MNSHLQKIFDFIQQSKQLSAADKDNLLKSAKDAAKDFDITAFKLDRTEKVKRTTAILLEETIEELEQKRKAVEGQNRELEIETSLERVRTVAMSMNKPDDLLNICKTQFMELKQLGFSELRNSLIGIFNDDKNYFTDYDYSDFSGGSITNIPYHANPIIDRSLQQMKTATDAFTEFIVEGKELEEWKAFRKQNGEYDDIRINDTAVLYYYFYSISQGSLGISTFKKISEEQLNILKKFRNVFDLSYKRYVDISNAEAQAKEAEIELALERVRARTMAMQHSDELADASFLLDSQVRALGIKTWGCAFNIYGDNGSTEWFSSEMGTMPAYPIPREDLFLRYYNEGQTGKLIYVETFAGEACIAHYNYLCTLPVVGESLKKIKESGGSFPVQQTDHVTYFKYGYLLFITLDPVPEAHDIFIRFAKVFEQTYTRFLDLQKAEAQAREAQIETALERVRSRSLAMQKSEELKEVIQVVYEQFVHLNVNTEHTGFVIDYKLRDERLIWVASKYGVPSQLTIPYFDSEYYNSFNEAKDKGWDFFATNLGFEEKNSFYRQLFKYIPGLPEDAKEFYFNCPGLAISTVLLDNVGLYIENFEGLPYSDEDNAILMRFGKVFQQTYTRFLDLQKAEAQARESQIEAALERVRSRTLAMQKSDELAETAAVLFQQLIALGIEPNRLYISIVKTEEGDTEFWITDEDGSKVSTAFAANLNDNASFLKMYEGWKQQKKSLVIDMQGEELQEYFRYLTSLGVPFKDGLEQKRRVQDIAYFSKGFIGMASPDEQPVETLQLLERFAAVFNLTFTRFNDLKIAEAHAEQAEQDLIAIKEARQNAEAALNELQATQKQLIQSEKMASLGELTAGIAHEIQNPLNFVNNFSEVSKELLDEMKEAIERGDIEEAKEIMNDIIKNLEKINHHGKRADGIVKGMLQHSRSSSAVKEPTDINKLADEYLRLAYHGLRAKDKSFNATLKTDFDESIGNISIIPQDIGRVILNLITNAFYVVDEKKKASQPPEGGVPYDPIVSVSTKKAGDKVLISVKDNGNGIPQNIVDKIFQPFFTTKPTGKGTGLGLSLAYDIVKAHGGEIKVNSKEGEGTEFLIQIPK